MKVILIGVAGAAGAIARYGLGLAVGTRSFPWSTLGINLVGSFLFGLVVTAGTQRGWTTTAIAPITIGFLGAFTTFSTFSYETYSLLRDDRASTAAVYVLVSVIGGVLAAACGYLTARAAV